MPIIPDVALGVRNTAVKTKISALNKPYIWESWGLKEVKCPIAKVLGKVKTKFWAPLPLILQKKAVNPEARSSITQLMGRLTQDKGSSGIIISITSMPWLPERNQNLSLILRAISAYYPSSAGICYQYLKLKLPKFKLQISFFSNFPISSNSTTWLLIIQALEISATTLTHPSPSKLTYVWSTDSARLYPHVIFKSLSYSPL